MKTTRRLKVMSVVGARPNFMKIAPIVGAIDRYNRGRSEHDAVMQHLLVHTGQHYDSMMSDAFFQDLRLPKPDFFLGVGAGSHARQTGEIMKHFEPVLLEEKPDVLLVVGDVNSTVACALVASKIFYDDRGRKPLIGHIEAGLRSFDRTMPEEINRIVTDHLSDFHFVTEESGIENLLKEGIPSEKIHFVGNTMIDTLLSHVAKADQSRILDKLRLVPESTNNEHGSSFALLTLHRPSNVDQKDNFIEILQALQKFNETLTIVFPAHPRTQKRIKEMQLEEYFHFIQNGDSAQQGKLNVVDPVGYLDFLCLMKNARLVLTDSGGVQEETTCLGVPCVTIRANTERPVTVSEGTNLLAGLRKDTIVKAIQAQLAKAERTGRIPKNWDGKAAERIVDIIFQQTCSERKIHE
jgi:UDP-N-acetylglucosamine 2-epimerase (non-hydrolysing)